MTLAAHRFRASDGVEIAYGTAGPVGGRTVVLCHGIAAAGRQLAGDAAAFAEAGYRVLVPDLRGHGQSGKPPGKLLAKDFSIARLAEDMFDLLDREAVTTVDWVGNSLGGIVALPMLHQSPERFRSFATFGTAYRLDLPAWAAPMLAPLWRLAGRERVARLTARSTSADPAARALIGDILAHSDPGTVAATAVGCANYNYIGHGQTYPGPVLLLRGSRDGPVNLALKSTLAAMQGRPNFTLVDLPGGGHCANLDATAAFRGELLKFWGRT
ncbi:MAG: soluble epoxide hydrolase / lipid-phosphate phosphatase [Devosia sp.]|nr:soluble epoxide hydrolase / lipid-phosphate phosphatase [Devosia sp.]